MPSLERFGGDSAESMRHMAERKSLFFVFAMGKTDNALIEALNDPRIVDLLNNEHFLCFKIDPISSSVEHVEKTLNNIFVPTIYFLDQNKLQQNAIKETDSKDTFNMQLNLKRQLLISISYFIKDMLDTNNFNGSKQILTEYLIDIDTKLQNINTPNCDVRKVIEVKKSNNVAKLKIKIPSKEITIIQDFLTTSSLNDVKMFVLNNVKLSKGSLKCVAHRQFMNEDFNQTLDKLKLYPSSTIYFHIIPSNQWLHCYTFWRDKFYSAILRPYNFVRHYWTLMFRSQPSQIEFQRNLQQNNTQHTNEKFTYKRDSNIHQLRHRNFDNDDKTYNGNSTQQM